MDHVDLQAVLDKLPDPDRRYPVLVTRTSRFLVWVDAESADEAREMVDETPWEYVPHGEDPFYAHDIASDAEHDDVVGQSDPIGPVDSCRECGGEQWQVGRPEFGHAPTCSHFRHYLNTDVVYDPERKTIVGVRLRCSCRLDGLAQPVGGKNTEPDTRPVLTEAEAAAAADGHAAGKRHVVRGHGLDAA